MTTENTQTVVEATPAPAEQGASDTSARTDDLDQLLAQYDQQRVQPDPQPTPEPPPQEPPISTDRIRALEQRLFQDEVNEAVNNIVGDMKIPRRAAIGWLDQYARENPKLAQAFLNKSQDPKTWKRVEKVLAEELRKEFSSLQVDPQATADREAVAAAVRGASTKAPAAPPPKLGTMSDAKLRQHISEEYGFDPGF